MQDALTASQVPVPEQATEEAWAREAVHSTHPGLFCWAPVSHATHRLFVAMLGHEGFAVELVQVTPSALVHTSSQGPKAHKPPNSIRDSPKRVTVAPARAGHAADGVRSFQEDPSEDIHTSDSRVNLPDDSSCGRCTVNVHTTSQGKIMGNESHQAASYHDSTRK